jgi:hypothetical protein
LTLLTSGFRLLYGNEVIVLAILLIILLIGIIAAISIGE